MQRYRITYRPTDAELGEIYTLFSQDGNREQAFDMSDLHHIVEHADLMVAVYDQLEQQMVAFAWVKQSDKDSAWVMDPMVHPAYRRKGMGHMLLRYILTHAKLEKCARIELAVHADESKLFDYSFLPWMSAAASSAVDSATDCLRNRFMADLSYT